MGVGGLSAFVRQHGGRAAPATVDIREIALAAVRRSAQQSVVCVDGNSLLYFLYDGSGLNWLLGGQYSGFERKVEEFVDAFSACMIKLVFFFDGLPDALKRETSLERRAKDAKYASTVLGTLQDSDTVEGPSKLLLPILASEVLVTTLQRRGIEVRFCNYQADQDIAIYCATHIECIGAISQDSDFLIFDMKEAYYIPLESLLIKRQNSGKWIITCQPFRTEHVANILGFDKKWLPIFAGLVGNDYTRDNAWLNKIHRQINIVPGDNITQLIRKVAKFLSQFTAVLQEEKESNVYTALLRNLRKDERSLPYQALKRSADTYSTSLEPVSVLELKYDSGMNDMLNEELRSGQCAPQIVSIIAQAEFWTNVVLLDHTLFDPSKIYEDVRVSLYRMLLSNHLKKAQRDSDPSTEPAEQQESNGNTQRKKKKKKKVQPPLCISEYSQSQRSYRKQKAVQLHHDSLSTVPPIALLRSMPQDQRLRRLLAIFRASPLSTELAGLPPELLLSCAVLRYLLSDTEPSDENEGEDENDGLARAEPLLYEWELEAYLAHLLMLQRDRIPVIEVEWDWKMTGNDRKRFVCLASLVQTGLQLALYLHQSCGSPLDPSPVTSRLYDGSLFLKEYIHYWNERKGRQSGMKSVTTEQSDALKQAEKNEHVDSGRGDQDEGLTPRACDDDTEASSGDNSEEQHANAEEIFDEKSEDQGQPTEEERRMLHKLKEAILVALRPSTAGSANQPTIFKLDTPRPSNKKRRKNRSTTSNTAATNEHASEEDDSERLIVHNSFALLSG